MAWIEITEANVRTRLSGPELAALKTAALAAGQGSPLAELVAQTVAQVRGYVAAGGFSLEAGQTIPARLELATLNLIRFELATRLPVASLLTEDRRKASESALQLLRDTAAGRFIPEAAAIPDAEESAAPAPAFDRADRDHGLAQQDGL